MTHNNGYSIIVLKFEWILFVKNKLTLRFKYLKINSVVFITFKKLFVKLKFSVLF